MTKENKVKNYNWINTLEDFASLCGVFAGFSFAFLVLLVESSQKTPEFFASLIGINISAQDVATFLFSISAVIFIFAAEYFLRAKEFMLYSLPSSFLEILEETIDIVEDYLEKSYEKSRENEIKGRYLYNLAILVWFAGIIFLLEPYNVIVGLIIGVPSFLFQLYQVIKFKGFKP